MCKKFNGKKRASGYFVGGAFLLLSFISCCKIFRVIEQGQVGAYCPVLPGELDGQHEVAEEVGMT